MPAPQEFHKLRSYKLSGTTYKLLVAEYKSPAKRLTKGYKKRLWQRMPKSSKV